MQHSHLVHEILPLRGFVVTLRWLYNSQPGFFHHVQLHGWLRFLLGSPEDFSDYLVVEPLENGHIQYKKNDLYRFRMIALRGSETLLNKLLKQLPLLPESVPEQAIHRGPFGNNLSFVSITDSFTNQPIQQLADAHCYDDQDLTMETAIWSRSPAFKIAFTTPARLKRAKRTLTQTTSGNERFCRSKDQLTWELVTQRLTDTLINIYQSRTGERPQRGDWPAATIHNALAVWMNQQYQSQHQKHKKDISGIIAQLQISLPEHFPADLLALIVLGQYIGIGQNRSFGMGLYQLQDAYGVCSYPRPPAAQSLLDNFLSDTSLRTACAVMHPRHPDFYHCEDEQQTEQQEASLFEQLKQRQQAISSQNYQASHLHPLAIDKPDGGVRWLSIPDWHDRTLQKAVIENLSPTLESLWMKHSYGYRKGHSRLNARDQINQHIQEGYEWVLESDIQSFFDSVDWLNLQQRLSLLFPNEPLVDLIMQWVQAPKEDNNGQLIQRHQGLPQGAPVSPLLANLLLDDLDQDMIDQGHHIIRYADDFVMLFKTENEAQAALQSIHASLKEHGLSINKDKTRIVHANQGFKYLGYLFIDGYAIESKNAKVSGQSSQPQPTDNNSTPENQAIGERDTLGTFLIITGSVAMLSEDKQRLNVDQYEHNQSYPWATLSGVLLVGPHHITTPALKSAMKHGVPIHFANHYGQYQGCAAGPSPHALGADFWLQQSQYLQNPVHALAISQQLILARITSIKHIIQRRDKKSAELPLLEKLIKKLKRAENLDQLRGYEGQASKQLWAFFKRTLDPQWQFSGRNRRPPKDPVNAMLSLGYTFLYSLVDSINCSIGLYAWQGALHQQHGYHRTLASDLMEPARYIVERTVLTLINRGQVKVEDFALSETECRISSEVRKVIYNALLVQITQSPQGKDTLLNKLRDQSYQLALTCRLNQRFIALDSKS